MANPTTNYGFVLPTPTDLVTDLPADFDVALQGVDTRLKALQPGTTLGDLAFSSATANTNTRLGIGSAAQVLTVAGGVPTWATPAAGGGANWSLLNSGGTALTGAATITVSGISGADKIMIQFAGASSANASATFNLRFNADSGSNYGYSSIGVTNTTAYSTFMVGSEGGGPTFSDQVYLGGMANSDTAVVHGFCFMTGCNASGSKSFHASTGGKNPGGGAFGQSQQTAGGFYSGASTISSVSLLSSTGNFDAGTIYVYTSA